ncbi:MAG TPA: hypothetical protein VJ625_10090 [Propionibacteriaceae bacterium]|nr:hypothetical protein [Propionibacteriaceae bacterium]
MGPASWWAASLSCGVTRFAAYFVVGEALTNVAPNLPIDNDWGTHTATDGGDACGFGNVAGHIR